jgi:probable rRNA maturation factor
MPTNRLPPKVSAVADGGPSRKDAAASGVTLEVEVERHGDAWRDAEFNRGLIEQAARAAIGAAPSLPQGTYQVTFVLTDDAEMRALNRTWRGKDVATNVLSFPAHEKVKRPGPLGDVVLAYETTLKEVRAQGITLDAHVAHLVVHGVLHLIGFDHLEDVDAERMEAIERTALASLGIGDPYADNAGASR